MEQPAHWRGFDLGLELADDVSSAEMAALGATLAPHTGTPGGCVFCFWVGSGVWVSDNGETDHGHLSDEGNEELNAPIRERWKRELEALENFSAGRASEPRALSLHRTARPHGAAFQVREPGAVPEPVVAG